MKNEKIHLLLIPFTAIVFFLPAFLLGSGGSDLLPYMIWPKNFSEQLWSGELYPRWLMNMNGGCGEPMFFISPPVAFYIIGLFHFATNIAQEGWYPLALAGLLILNMAGFFCYLWLRNITNHVSALGAALAYMVMPHLGHVFYISFSPTSFFVFALMPLLLYFTRKMAEGSNKAIAGYAIAFALLMMSSIPGLVVVSGLPIVYYYFCLKDKISIVNTLKLLTAIVLAFGLAAIYIIPMLSQNEFIYISTDKAEAWSSHFDYAKNFLFSFSNPEYAIFTILLKATCIILIMAIIAYSIWRRIKILNGKAFPEATFWLIIMYLAIFMMTPLSKFIWDLVYILQVIQFPGHFTNIVTISMAGLISLWLYHYSLKNKHKNPLQGLAIILPLLSIAIPLSLSIESRWDIKGSSVSSIVKTHYSFQRMYHSDNLPITVNKAWHKSDDLAYCQQRIHVLGGDASVDIKKWKPRDILLHIDNKTDSTIAVSQFYYPGWTAWDINNSGQVFKIRPMDVKGLIELSLPAGKYDINLKLEALPSEQYGKYISLITLCFLIMLLLYNRKRR